MPPARVVFVASAGAWSVIRRLIAAHAAALAVRLSRARLEAALRRVPRAGPAARVPAETRLQTSSIVEGARVPAIRGSRVWRAGALHRVRSDGPSAPECASIRRWTRTIAGGVGHADRRGGRAGLAPASRRLRSNTRGCCRRRRLCGSMPVRYPGIKNCCPRSMIGTRFARSRSRSSSGGCSFPRDPT